MLNFNGFPSKRHFKRKEKVYLDLCIKTNLDEKIVSILSKCLIVILLKDIRTFGTHHLATFIVISSRAFIINKSKLTEFCVFMNSAFNEIDNFSSPWNSRMDYTVWTVWWFHLIS